MSAVLETVIDSVLVFPQGAQVTRMGEIPKGAESLEIAELPLGLLDDSVSISLLNVGNEVLTSQVAVGLAVAGTREKPELAEEIRAACLERRRVESNLKAEKRLLTHLMTERDAPRPDNLPHQEPPHRQLTKILELREFQKQQGEKIAGRIHLLEAELREAVDKHEQLKTRESQAAREVEPEELRKIVRVGLNQAVDSQSARFSLTYRVEAARWAPAYSARFDSSCEEVLFSMRALVCQATEEDWGDVNLSLSTALPHSIRECPELKSRRLGRAQPSTPSRWVPPPLGTKELFSGFESALAVQAVAKPKPKPSSVVQPVPPPPPPMAAPEPRRELSKSESVAFGSAPGLGGSAEGWAQEEMETGALHLLEDADDAYCEPAPVMAAPAGAMRARSVPMKKRKSGRGGGGGDKFIRELEVKTLDQRSWSFAQLRLPDWENRRRGELVYSEDWEIYTETLQVSHTIIQKALSRYEDLTNGVLRKALPSKHVPPSALSGFDYRYQTSGRVDVPADSQFHSLPVFQAVMTSKAHYVVVPRKSLDVFRSAQVENGTLYGLCEGPVDVSWEDDFLHTTSLGQAAPSSTFELGLGVCEGLKVSREVAYEETSAGLMSQSTSLPHEVTYQLVNHLSAAVTITIRERLPEPSEKDKNDLKISAQTDGWKEFQDPEQPDLTTGLEKAVTLEAGASAEAKLAYTITFSSKYELAGGNRREPRA